MSDHGSVRGPAGTKIPYVETLRGIACILLVAYHVIGDSSGNGLHLLRDHVFSFANRMLIDVRMPLFSFISGFVFSAYAADLMALRGKIAAKARRLLIPMAVVASLHYGLQAAFAPQAQQPVYSIFFLPYEHFWYLQATFLLMLTVFLATWWLGGDGTRAATLLLGPCMVVAVLFDRWHPDVFSSWKAFYLAPYFLTGYLISHSAQSRAMMEHASKRPDVIALMTVLLALLFWIELRAVENLVPLSAPERRALGVAVGLATCLFFFMARFRSRILTFIGDKSYAIFLLHVFFTAGSRIVLERVVPGLGVPVLFVAGLIAGVSGPILVSWAALKNRAASLLLLGVRQRAAPPAPRKLVFGQWEFVIVSSAQRRSDDRSRLR